MDSSKKNKKKRKMKRSRRSGSEAEASDSEFSSEDSEWRGSGSGEDSSESDDSSFSYGTESDDDEKMAPPRKQAKKKEILGQFTNEELESVLERMNPTDVNDLENALDQNSKRIARKETELCNRRRRCMVAFDDIPLWFKIIFGGLNGEKISGRESNSIETHKDSSSGENVYRLRATKTKVDGKVDKRIVGFFKDRRVAALAGLIVDWASSKFNEDWISVKDSEDCCPVPWLITLMATRIGVDEDDRKNVMTAKTMKTFERKLYDLMMQLSPGDGNDDQLSSADVVAFYRYAKDEGEGLPMGSDGSSASASSASVEHEAQIQPSECAERVAKILYSFISVTMGFRDEQMMRDHIDREIKRQKRQP